MLRTLSAKFSVFTVVLVLWITLAVTVLEPGRGLLAAALILALVAGLISRFTARVLSRPLVYLQKGLQDARNGQFEPIRVSRTGDEIEELGNSFNQMIDTLRASKAEIREHQELLEERIRQRTEELDLAKQKAVAASGAKSEFLGNMSHELRTPMNSVLGMLDIVLDSRLTGEQREHLEIARRSAFALLDSLNDVLDLSKIETGRMIIDPAPFSPRELLEDLIRIHSTKAAHKALAVTAVIDPELPARCSGDAMRIRQMFTNLLSNAVKFTDRGEVEVKLWAEADPGGGMTLYLEVRDTGPGIAPEKLATIFDKFTQGDASTSRRHPGAGLGLALTRRLAALHGGTVDVQSTPGAGSTFRLGVTCNTVDDNDMAAPSAAPNKNKAKRILVVEDNAINQKVVSAILKKGQYRVSIASNGKEAIQMLEDCFEEPVALILMDVQMPVMDGLEATRRIRQRDEWRHLPIIAMTADGMNGDRERCLEAGMTCYVSKPVNPQSLLQLIGRFISSGTAEKAAEAVSNGLLHLFLESATDRLRKIDEAIAQQDRTMLRTEARRLAAAAERIGATAVSVPARRIELVASYEDLGKLTKETLALALGVAALEQKATIAA